MKKYLIIAIAFLPLASSAQDIKEEKVKKGKDEANAFIVSYRYPKSVAKATMESVVKDNRMKRSNKKGGYYTYKGAMWSEVSSTKMDYSYKVSGNKRKSTIYIIASKGYDNYVTTANDPQSAANIKNFLKSLENKMDITKLIKEKKQEIKQLEQQR